MALWLHNYRPANNFDEMFDRMNALLREFDRPGTGRRTEAVRRGTWPLANLRDEGERFVLQAVVPGVDPGALKLSATGEGLTIQGERALKAPEGYSVHRQERASTAFSRTFAFPTRIDPDRIEAVFKDGVLWVTALKAQELRPREIAVKVG